MEVYEIEVLIIFDEIRCAKGIFANLGDICKRLQKNTECKSFLIDNACLFVEVAKQVLDKALLLESLIEKGIEKSALAIVCTALESLSGFGGGSREKLSASAKSTSAASQNLDSEDNKIDAAIIGLSRYINSINTIKDTQTTWLELASAGDDATTSVDNMLHGHADLGNSYYLVEYSGVQIRGRFDAAGDISFRTPVNTSIRMSVFDSRGDRYGTFEIQGPAVTGATGLPLFTLQSAKSLMDADGDMLADVAEYVIGTSPTLADTDGDGISDFAEIQQGLDPLGGRGFPTGVIADLALRGESQAIDIQGSTTDATQQTAYVATGSYGLALVDASQFQNPIILGQLDLAGIAVDVAVDSPTKIAVVAAGEGGLHFVDVSDPMLPKRLRTASVNALQVEVIDGIAFVATPDRVLAYDVASGDQIGFGVVLNSPARGMTHEGNALFVMSADRTLQAFTVNGFAITARGSIQLTHGGGQISVSNGVLYAAAIASTAQGGFATADIRNLDSLSEISPSDVSGGFAYPGQVIVPNGSGLGLLGGLALTGQRFAGVQIVNTSDPANTNQVVTQFATSAAPTSISIASGIGFVSTAKGLQVVNYVPFDTKGVAPSITITGPTGATIDEGSLVSFGANVTDDVQVRNVELLVNGVVVRNAVSAPFDLSAVMPSLSTGATTVRIQARATDTGGNSKLSNELTFTLTPDSTPPTLLGSNPTNDGAGFQMKGLTLFFSEPIDSTKLAVGGVRLTNLGKNAILGGGDDTTVPIASITALSDRRISVQFDAQLAAGRYQVRFDPSILADRAGNAIAQPIDFPFTSYDLDALNANAWIGENGNWNDAQNWSAGRVPGENDAVIIDRLNTNIRVRLSTGNVKVKSIISNEELVLDGGNLTVTEATVFNGRFQVGNGSTFTASSSQAIVIANGETKIDGGSLTAQNGAIIRLPNVTSYTHTAGNIRDEALIRADGVGSLIDLRNVTSIDASPTRDDYTRIQATAGGRVDLRSATQIVANDRYGVYVTATGQNSVVDLSSLASIADAGSENSELNALNAGHVIVRNAPFSLFVTGVAVLTETSGVIEGVIVLGTNSTRIDR